jgi:hypothetical protein
MGRYKLTNKSEGMSNDEFSNAKEQDRLDAHPDRDKIIKMRALLKKEKDARENNVEEGEAVDLAIEASQKKAGIRENDIEDNIERRIEDLSQEPTKRKFLDDFLDLYKGLIGEDPYFVKSVFNYLNTGMDNQNQQKTMGESSDGYVEEISETDSNALGSIVKILRDNQISISDINGFYKTHKQDIIKGDINPFDEEDVMMNYNEYSSINSEDFSDLREHFSRFLKPYQ